MTDDPPPLPDWVEAMLPSRTHEQDVPAGVTLAPEFEHLLLPVPKAGAPPPGTMVRQRAMTPVASSNIASVGHDGESLWISFLNGTLYRYPTAGADLHAAMLAAESPGQFFHRHVRGAHKGERVT